MQDASANIVLSDGPTTFHGITEDARNVKEMCGHIALHCNTDRKPTAESSDKEKANKISDGTINVSVASKSCGTISKETNGIHNTSFPEHHEVQR